MTAIVITAAWLIFAIVYLVWYSRRRDRDEHIECPCAWCREYAEKIARELDTL